VPKVLLATIPMVPKMQAVQCNGGGGEKGFYECQRTTARNKDGVDDSSGRVDWWS